MTSRLVDPGTESPGPVEKMAFEERRACLWHAYHALDGQGKGTGIKSQLKVRVVMSALCLVIVLMFITAEKSLLNKLGSGS